MTAKTRSGDSLEALKPLVGAWRLVATFKDMSPVDAGARVSFEWLPGERFLIQRWEVPIEEAPDGMVLSQGMEDNSRPLLSLPNSGLTALKLIAIVLDWC